MLINNSRLFVAHYNDYINISLTYKYHWDIIRLLWIGYLKNDDNNKCYFKNLSKDVILLIINLLQLSLVNYTDCEDIIILKQLPYGNDDDSDEDEDEDDDEDSDD